MKKAAIYIVIMVLLEGYMYTGGILNNGQVDESIQKYQQVTVKQLTQGRWRRSLETLSTVPNAKKGHHDQVTFVVEGFAKRWVLNLSLNQLLLPFGSKTSYTSNDGSERALASQPTDNCYYQGTIQGLKKSSVALSTCQGLEGVIFDGEESFYIQPHNKETDANSHIMYRMKDLKLTQSVCDQNNYANYSNDILKNSKRFRRSLESETKYIELVIVNDFSQFNRFKDMTKTIQRSRSVANLVDSLYRSLNIRVALIELIIWNKNDPILVDADSSKALENFNKWRNKELIEKRKLRHDNAQLLTNIDFTGPTVGKAHVLSICTTRSAGVVQDHSISAASTAATFAHEMGHNLGMGHDTKDCQCDSKEENQDCVMSGVARSVPATDWSSCSRKQFEVMLDKGLDSCLFNKPKKLYGNPVCGNGFREEGEECDCGSAKDCAKYSDNCCNNTTCKLKPGAECNKGPCCDKCKLQSSGVLCRNKVTECDLPEHCTGKSALCPENRFVYHGKPCSDGKGYCNQGICPTHNGQCQVLWGDDVKSGPEICYTLNERGSHGGNCDKLPDGKFAKCKKKDIYCGSLHCTNTKTNLPIIGTERTAYKYTWHVDGKTVQCRSSSVELGEDTDDPGMAREGTKCGQEKVCISNQCLNITDLLEKNIKCPGDCSGNGICDSKGECYCNDCWKGDDCTTSTPCLNVGARVGHSKLAGYIILVFIIIALLVIIVAAFIYREKLKAKWQKRKSAGRRYESTHSTSPTQSAKPSVSQPDNKYTPFATTAPKPKPNTYSSKQPGKIELPSWPSDSNTNQDISRVPRRPPPGPPNAHRASSPPTGSIRDNPMYNQRPDSYAGVLDRKPQPSFPVASVDRTIHNPGNPVLPPINQSVRPSDVKRTQPIKPPKPPQPSHRPGRVPPPTPNRPGHPPQT